MTVGSFFLGAALTSPTPARRQTARATGPMTGSVTMQVIEQKFSARADVDDVDATAIKATFATSTDRLVITRLSLAAGDQLSDGQVAAEVSFRPIFVMAGALVTSLVAVRQARAQVHEGMRRLARQLMPYAEQGVIESPRRVVVNGESMYLATGGEGAGPSTVNHLRYNVFHVPSRRIRSSVPLTNRTNGVLVRLIPMPYGSCPMLGPMMCR